jgi:hypothetical protein
VAWRSFPVGYGSVAYGNVTVKSRWWPVAGGCPRDVAWAGPRGRRESMSDPTQLSDEDIRTVSVAGGGASASVEDPGTQDGDDTDTTDQAPTDSDSTDAADQGGGDTTDTTDAVDDTDTTDADDDTTDESGDTDTTDAS